MSQRANELRNVILEVAERQVASSPQAKALRELMPEAVEHLLQHIASTAAMVIDDKLTCDGEHAPPMCIAIPCIHRADEDHYP